MVNISVVTTVYKSEPFLEEFISKTLEALKIIDEKNFEIIFVIDGITDNSKEYLINQKTKIPQIKMIELSRNFGHHIAASAGLKCALGKLVFLIDCDLEVSPLTLVDFKRHMDINIADVVYGVQKKRKGAFIESFFGGLFWKIFNLLSDIKIPKNVITERLMTKEYVRALTSLNEKNVFMAGMMYWVGYNQQPIYINKGTRQGKSSYSLRKRVNLLIEAITSFSEKPLKILFSVGYIITLLSIAIAVFHIVRKIIYPETILIGYASLFILILFTLGILIFSIGLIGIYLSKIFKETKNRPLYIIKNTNHE